MQNKEFLSFWNSRFPGALPLTYSLKDILEERWFRIHNFSKKRYPASTSDSNQLLKKQNKLIEDLFTEGSFYFLLISSFSNKVGFPVGYEEQIDTKTFTQLESIPLHKIAPEEYGPEENYLCLAINDFKWKNHSVDQLLMALANNKLSNVAFIAKEENRLIAPYDGGVDVILENETMRDVYRQKYSSWLPANEEGL